MTEENIIVSVEAKFPQLKGLMRLPRHGVFLLTCSRKISVILLIFAAKSWDLFLCLQSPV